MCTQVFTSIENIHSIFSRSYLLLTKLSIPTFNFHRKMLHLNHVILLLFVKLASLNYNWRMVVLWNIISNSLILFSDKSWHDYVLTKEKMAKMASMSAKNDETFNGKNKNGKTMSYLRLRRDDVYWQWLAKSECSIGSNNLCIENKMGNLSAKLNARRKIKSAKKLN